METLNQVKKWFFGFVAFFIPLFLMILSSPIFSATRIFVLLLITGAVFVLWIIKNFLNRGLVFSKFNFWLPLCIFIVLLLVSTFSITAPGALNAAIFGKAGLFLVLIMFFLGSIQILDAKDVKAVISGLVAAVIVMSAAIIFALLSLLNKFVPMFILSEKELLRGEMAVYFLIFFITLGVFFFTMFAGRKKAGLFVGVIFSFIGILILAIQLMKPDNRPIFLPFASGWAVTIEIFKNFKSLLFGSGFNQFSLFSNLYRTAEMNSEKLAFLRFSENANAYLDLLSSVGILGFFAFGFTLVKFFGAYFRLLQKTELMTKNTALGLFSGAPILVLCVAFLFVPLSPILLFLFFLCLVLAVTGFKSVGLHEFESLKLNLVNEEGEVFSIQSLQQSSGKSRLLAPKIFAGVIGIIFALVFYKTIYAMLGDVHYFGVLRAYAANSGTTAYEEANRAVGANQLNDDYAMVLSDINLRLAFVLNSQKKLSDQDKQKIAILVNQAVSAARRGVDLNPNKVGNWESLGGMYQQLIATDVTAKNLAVSAFNNAVTLAPRDAALRVRFAQLLYAIEAYQDAIGQLNAAITLKSDYANAYYYLGLSYKQLKQPENAKKAFNLALSFVQKKSKDEELLNNEIANVNVVATPTPTPQIPVAPPPEQKLIEPAPETKLENIKKDLLQLNQPTGSVTPSTSVTPTVSPE
jgi:tetratricopeptide (TPR) repeat protein